MQRILIDLHQSFFVSTNRDVPLLLNRIKTKILKDVHIVFSSVIPIDTDPRLYECFNPRHDLWITATQFGAHCYPDIVPHMTHLVSLKVNFN